MTDERSPEASPTPSGEPAPSAEPPPLAPYVNAAPIASEASPPASPQPAVTWAAPPAVAVAQGGRTGLAAAAGVVLLVLGVLGGLLGLLVAVVGGSFVASLGDLGYFPEIEGGDPTAILGGVVAFFGIIIVIYSVVYILAGIGILRSRTWGRVLGLIVGILSGLIWLGGLGQADQANIPFTLVMAGIHVYVVAVLIMFWRTKTA